jgi:hypothetical protein
MSANYGANQFSEGFKIIKQNRNVAYEENGEQQLSQMIGHLQFQDGEALKSFINFCTTYLIV